MPTPSPAEPPSGVALTPAAPSLPTDSDATVRAAGELIALERQQVELRREQIALQGVEGERAHRYALELLAAQERDLKDRRRAEASNGRLGLVFLVVLVVAFVSLTAYALQLGKDAFILDLVKVLAGALAGGGVGYGVGVRKREGDGAPQNPAGNA